MKGGGIEKDGEDGRQVDTLKQWPVRKAHGDKRAQAWDAQGPGWLWWAVPGAAGQGEGAGLRVDRPEGPGSKSPRGGRKRQGQPPRRSRPCGGRGHGGGQGGGREAEGRAGPARGGREGAGRAAGRPAGPEEPGSRRGGLPRPNGEDAFRVRS